MPEELLVLTAEQFYLISQINQQVNHEIKYQTDLQTYKKLEHWTLPKDKYGDCEDYALLKAEKLREAGIPEHAIRLAVCDTPYGGHAVLVVKRRESDLVLDNNFDIPMSPKRLHFGHQYRWIQIQTPDRNWRTAANGLDHL